MSAQHIPKRLDPFKQIGSGIDISGQIELKSLARLEDLLADQEGAVEVSLSFYRDEQGFAIVAGDVAATVNLACQRCLQADALDLVGEFAFALIREQSEAGSLPEGYEPLILDTPELDLHELVEEELILTLPIVHYHQQGCHAESQGDSFGGDKNETLEKPNPFAVLEKLKS